MNIKDKIEYIVVCVNEFARQRSLSMQKAYNYLRQFKGIDYMDQFYDVEHLFSVEEAINNMAAICRKNGGYLK